MQKYIILGNSLTSKLKLIEHPIAHFILKCAEDKEHLNVDFSYFDFVKEDGKISFLKNRWEGDGQEFVSSRRETMKIGRLIIALSQKKNINFSDKDIEDFVNKYKVFQQDSSFELFKGKNISKWYNETEYDKNGEPGTSLYNSCMRYKNCKSFFTIYEKSPNISLLCLLNKDKKLQGRAILWENIEMNGKRITFMDRVYTYKYATEESFKDFALKNGWWFKSKQSNQVTEITNGKEILKEYELKSYLPSNIKWDGTQKPYMDTLRFVKEDIINGEVVEYLSSEGNSYNYKQYWTCTSGNHNTNHGYLSIKDSSLALFNYLKSPVNIISPKIMESNNIKYRIENNHTIKSFIKEKIEQNINKYINDENINNYINFLNIGNVRSWDKTPHFILNNIEHLNITNKIVDYLNPDEKIEFIKDYLIINKKHLKNLKNIGSNKIKVLPSLKEHIEANGWPAVMLELINNVYDTNTENPRRRYNIVINNTHWEIPLDAAEIVDIGINFNVKEEEIINQIITLCKNNTISFSNIFLNLNGFKIGDKVICTNQTSPFYNTIGVVKEFLEHEPRIGVAFKEIRGGGHNLSTSGRAKTKHGYGYYMYPNEIQLLETYAKNDFNAIFNKVQLEKQLEYIKKELVNGLHYNDIKKFHKNILMEIIMLDLRSISDRFDINEINQFIKKTDDYDFTSYKNFYFIKEKSPNI